MVVLVDFAVLAAVFLGVSSPSASAALAVFLAGVFLAGRFLGRRLGGGLFGGGLLGLGGRGRLGRLVRGDGVQAGRLQDRLFQIGYLLRHLVSPFPPLCTGDHISTEGEGPAKGNLVGGPPSRDAVPLARMGGGQAFYFQLGQRRQDLPGRQLRAVHQFLNGQGLLLQGLVHGPLAGGKGEGRRRFLPWPPEGGEDALEGAFSPLGAAEGPVRRVFPGSSN